MELSRGRESRPFTLKVRPDGIPAELRSLDQWLGWKWEHRDGSFHQVAVDCLTGDSVLRASSFEAAIQAQHRFGADGVGLLLVGRGYVCVSLAECHDRKVGTASDWALDIVKQVGSYTELSPCGSGFLVVGRGILPADGVSGSRVAMTGTGSFLPMTGWHSPDWVKTVNASQAPLLELYHRLRDVGGLSDDELLVRALAAPNGREFKALWEADDALWAGENAYASYAEADLALCRRLLWWTQGDVRRVKSLFAKSALAKRKQAVQDNYLNRTIRKALVGLDGFRHDDCANNAATSINSSLQSLQSLQYLQSSAGADEDEGEDNEQGGQGGGGQRSAAVLELADADRGLELDEACFNLVKRLRKYADDNPERFLQDIVAYCEHSGRPYEDCWAKYLDVWDRVWVAEDVSLTEWVIRQAEEYPYPLSCSQGKVHAHVAGFAWHMSQLKGVKNFWFPVEELATYHKVRRETIYAWLRRLREKDQVIKLVKKYDHKKKLDPGEKPKSDEYIFIGPPSDGSAPPTSSSLLVRAESRFVSPCQSHDKPFKSRHLGGYISPSAFLAEMMCERKASHDRRELPADYLDEKSWSKYFERQVDLAEDLLAEHSIDVILSALRTPKGKHIRSLGDKSHFGWLLAAEQERANTRHLAAGVLRQAEVDGQAVAVGCPAGDLELLPLTPRLPMPQRNLRTKLAEL
jgi:hypothetical protein